MANHEGNGNKFRTSFSRKTLSGIFGQTQFKETIMKSKITFLIIALILIDLIANFGALRAQVNFQWTKSTGGVGYDYGYSIALDASGNVYTTGTFSGTVDFDPGAGTFNLTSAGGYEVFISKLDASGNFIWAKSIGGAGNEVGYSIVLDATGSVYTTGYFSGTVDFNPGAGTFSLTSVSNDDIFISKLDASGNFIWAKSIGGAGYDYGISVVLDVSGNVYTSGYFFGTVDFDPGVGTFSLTSAGSYDVFISKLDAFGNFIWAKNMGGANVDRGASITLDPSGNVYTTGYFSGTADFDPGVGTFNLISSASSWDIFISKLDASGNFIWAKSMSGANNDLGNSVTIDATGNVYTTGYFSGTVDFDPGVGTNNLTSSGVADIFISKLDASGNFIWAKRIGGSSSNWGSYIRLDPSGNVYTTGYFSGTTDFDPGTGNFNITSAGSQDIFISKLDVSGNFLWAKSMGGPGSDWGYSIALDISGNVYTTGYFSGTVDFDPGASVFNLTAVGVSDVFVLKLNQGPTYIDEMNSETNFNIFPNPNTGVFKIQIDKNINNGEIILFNSLGQKVHDQTVIKGINNINADGLAKGLYNYILLQDKQELKTGKFVVN